MTKKEQRRFVSELTRNIKMHTLAHIESGAIPRTWDGIELREYLYEQFLHSRANHLLEGKRGREYRNTITVSNL